MKNAPKSMILITVLLAGIWIINLARPSAQEILNSQRDWVEKSMIVGEQVEGDFGTLYFSKVLTKGDAPTLYFVDEIITTPFARTWSSGGGHNILNLATQDVEEREGYFFSAQFLGADGKMTKGLFGILRDDTISSISASIDNQRITAQIIGLPDTSDRLYFMPFESSEIDIEQLRYTGVVLNVNYKSTPSMQFFISPDIFESQGKDVAYITEQ